MSTGARSLQSVLHVSFGRPLPLLPSDGVHVIAAFAGLTLGRLRCGPLSWLSTQLLCHEVFLTQLSVGSPRLYDTQSIFHKHLCWKTSSFLAIPDLPCFAGIGDNRQHSGIEEPNLCVGIDHRWRPYWSHGWKTADAFPILFILFRSVGFFIRFMTRLLYSVFSTVISVSCYFIPSLLRQCWLGDRNGIWPVKSGCWFVDGDNLTGALHSYISSCHHHVPHP